MKKVLFESELQKIRERYNQINNYRFHLLEQEPMPGQEMPMDQGMGMEQPPMEQPSMGMDQGMGQEDIVAVPETPNTQQTPDMGMGDENVETEEIDVSDIVNSTQRIETTMEKLINGIGALESKLSEMDSIVSKVGKLEVMLKSIMPETPQDRIKNVSKSSYPFNMSLDDYADTSLDKFIDKEEEYTITDDDIKNLDPLEIKKSFDPDYGKEDTYDFNLSKWKF